MSRIGPGLRQLLTRAQLSQGLGLAALMVFSALTEGIGLLLLVPMLGALGADGGARQTGLLGTMNDWLPSSLPVLLGLFVALILLRAVLTNARNMRRCGLRLRWLTDCAAALGQHWCAAIGAWWQPCAALTIPAC